MAAEDKVSIGSVVSIQRGLTSQGGTWDQSESCAAQLKLHVNYIIADGAAAQLGKQCTA